MSLNDFSNIVVSGDGAALSQVGFGTILLAAYHTKWPERTRVYTSVTQLGTDGFTTSDPVYRMVQTAFSQSPRPSSVKVGRLANAPVMTQRITPIVASNTAYTLSIELDNETKTEVTFTSGGGATLDQICDGIQAAIVAESGAGEPFEGLTVTPLGGATATALDLSTLAGRTFYLSGWDPALLKVEDRTPDPGIAADLDAIRNYDADWYGLAVSVNSRAICEEAADWAETQDVIFACNTSDWQAHDLAQVVDIQSVLGLKEYVRTICYFDLDSQSGYIGVAGLAERFPFDPGSPPGAGGVFHARTLKSVTADALTPTQKSNLISKGYTVYISTAGRGHTLGGKSAGGEFLDYTRFVDWFRVRLQESIAAMIMNNDRVPYDDRGLSMVEAVCRSRVSAGLRSGGISQLDADGNPPSVVIPKLSETDAADRANRILRDVMIEFKYAGAIHKIDPVRITVRI